MKSKITVSDLIMAIGGLVAFLFSFFSFFSFGDEGVSAWSGDGPAFASTVPAILGLAMVVWIVLELVGVALPDRVLTYDHAQIKGTWGIGAIGIMLSWLSVDGDKGFGFWMMSIGSAAMAVGAVMGLLGKGTELIDIPGIDDTGGDAGDADEPGSAAAPAASPFPAPPPTAPAPAPAPAAPPPPPPAAAPLPPPPPAG